MLILIKGVSHKNSDETFIDPIIDLADHSLQSELIQQIKYKLKPFISHLGNKSEEGHYYAIRTTETNSGIFITDTKVIVCSVLPLKLPDYEDLHQTLLKELDKHTIKKGSKHLKHLKGFPPEENINYF